MLEQRAAERERALQQEAPLVAEDPTALKRAPWSPPGSPKSPKQGHVRFILG